MAKQLMPWINAFQSTKSSECESPGIKPRCKTSYILVASFFFAVVTFLLCKITGSLYRDNDNYYVALVTAGIFDNNNYCIYINPLLCLLIKGLSILYSGADWFTFLSHFNLFFASEILFYVILYHPRWNALEKGALILWLFYWIVGVNMYSSNYTVWSGFFCFTGGICLFASSIDIKPALKRLLSTYFCILGICWRIEVFLLFIPFLLLQVSVLRFLSHDQIICSREWARSFSLLICMCVVFITFHYAVRFLPQNRESVRYNTARTTITDYAMKSWDSFDRKDLITKEVYNGILYWDFLLETENPDITALEQVADAGRQNLSIKEIFSSLSILVFWNKLLLFVPFFLLIVFGIANLVFGSFPTRLETVFAFLGTVLIALFFTMIGRFPIRVLLPLTLFTSFSLIETNRYTKSPNILMLLFLILVFVDLVGIGVSAYRARYRPPQWAINSRRDVSDNELYKTTVQEDNLFFWDVSDYGKEYYKDKGALMDHSFMLHNLSDGNWTYGQPYWNNLLHKINAENPAKALLDRPNTYYATNRPELVLQMLRGLYGADIQMIKMGVLPEGTPYWHYIPRSLP